MRRQPPPRRSSIRPQTQPRGGPAEGAAATSLVLYRHRHELTLGGSVDQLTAAVGGLVALRLLSNLETGKRKLLQVVFFGQPELDTPLRATECRSLVSRIDFSARMAGLGRGELRHHLCHRVAVAGWRGPEAFSAPARWVLWSASRGVPRAVNVLAHKCLMLAYGEGAQQATLRHALAAQRDAALAPADWLAGGAAALHAAACGAR